MRKIISKHEEGKKRKRNQLILGVFLIFVMFGSVLGFVIPFGTNGGAIQGEGQTPTLNTINYNGFEFTEQNGFWILNLNDNNFVFRYNPNQIENITPELNSLNDYYGKPLYVYSESIEAESEIYTNLFLFVEKIENACLKGERCNENLSIQTCEDNFIIIKESEDNKIVQENNCVFIQSNKEDLAKFTDEFLFKLLDII